MKVIKGIPANINKTVMGRITKEPLGRFKRKDSILVTHDVNIKATGYAGIITDKYCSELVLKEHENVPLYHNVARIDCFNDGDIVLLRDDGTINVLYERESNDNALLASEKCNFDCIMCPQPRGIEAESKTPFNLKLISLMNKSTKHLGITGGEPTLIGEGLFTLINACKKYIPAAQIDILSNGIKFGDFEYVKKMIFLQHPNLLFAIPLYADTDNEHNLIVQAKGFYKTIQGIYNLALFKQKIEIRVVILKVNYKRLPKLAEFIYHNFPFIYHIAFMGMETVGLAQRNIEQLWIDPHDYMPQLKDAILCLEHRSMNVSIYNLQLCILPKELYPFSVKSISSWKNIYLDECEKCDFKTACGGLFSSSINLHSAYIKPLRRN